MFNKKQLRTWKECSCWGI